MPKNAPPASAVGGRPKNPPSERLHAYGLRMSPDKKTKLLAIKSMSGVSIREWFEDHIERDYVALTAAKRK